MFIHAKLPDADEDVVLPVMTPDDGLLVVAIVKKMIKRRM